MVGVLVLINKHVLKPAAVKVDHLRVLNEDTHDFTNKVIKVNGISSSQAALILRKDLRHRKRKWVLRLLCFCQSSLR